MPIAEERRIRYEARRAGLKPGSERYQAYVYGTLNKIKEARKRKRGSRSK